MKKTLSALFLAAFCMTAAAQTLRNPVIGGYHPDPSVTRANGYFYLVNSSFQYFPGVPIYRSTDLVNWQQIGNVLTRESQIPLKGASSWLGIYAPTIRYNNGTWYMITTNVGNGGNFMVTAASPEGPWSEPIWLKQQGIDPSLYFENGKCYMVSNPDNTIMLCEIDPKTGVQLTESRAIWRGTGGRYPEGPHIYNKDGYYYLLISEGGTELAHKLTIARSRSIYGPYEGNPANPILTNCRMEGQDKQIQGTGHGDLVQAEDGSWWVTFLAYRNMGGSYHHLGRETCLAPVVWPEGEWPVVNGGNPVDTLMKVTHMLPQSGYEATPKDTVYTFKSLGSEWLYIQNPDMSKYSLTGGKLRLYGSKSSLTENDRPTFVGRRQENPLITVSCGVDAAGLKPGGEAGLTVYQIHDGHMDALVRRNDKGRCELVLRCRLKSINHEEEAIPLDNTVRLNRRGSHEPAGIASVRITVTSDGTRYDFYAEYKDDTKQGRSKTVKLGSFESSLVSTETAGGFTGVTIGMFATGEGSADFSKFSYTEGKAITPAVTQKGK